MVIGCYALRMPLSPTSGVPEARDASALGLGMLAAKAESVPIEYQIHSAS
jgi:hypothetical protein